jgi:heme-degrading monooxygenase HmoA
MFVRVTDIRTWPGRWPEYERCLLELNVVSREVAIGRLETWLAKSPDSENDGFVVSIWDSEDAAIAYESSEYLRQALSKLEIHLAGEYPVRRGDVKFIWDSTGARTFRQSRW